MAASRPIITSVPNGEITYVINEANCGLCNSPSDPKSLAGSIIWMYKNQEKAKDMGNNGKKYVEEHFSRENILKDYVKLIEKII
jgi:glycosyltransferase involved in cell wall biosynthesis